ncbi:DNA methyltransferase [[Clostridium] polysaccharolyticum]|uniref:site-specific DNA-methyltransferase (cytosine-N(4)-specific) n=1 Tax=[Clostridium] polysaccharolyticum TaxID=29364 RepID=A0A1I0EY24_9FIRM|nr:DNA methyltransferase [[Clostridium] polysaccharolyticum]SET50064.1 site-specific DNA-methyltransferase (cytosine-N4-specific) [[Clostridium] polysaccharolyticum]
MEQMSFLEEIGVVADKSEYIVDKFSAGDLCDERARQALEEKYESILEVTNRFDRRSVSYQLSKKDALHSWLKYKEGFSADLVGQILDDMEAKPGDLVMDPFMGSGTTALVCQMRGINSIGFDIMPISAVAIKAKANVMRYDQDEIRKLIAAVKNLSLPDGYKGFTPYVTITDTAYPVFNGQFIQYSSDWIKTTTFDDTVKNLFTLAVLNSLERCSYTTKSGQYLSWDCRSDKVKNANIIRKEQGRKLLPEKHVREEIQNVQDTIVAELEHILADIEMIQAQGEKEYTSEIDYREKSVLYGLAELEDGCLKGVITSPPYCNRYDYTRTYALELVYLGATEDGIKKMRQDLLSCTVESKTKVEALKEYYSSIGQEERFQKIYDTIQSNAAFTEIKTAMDKRKDNGDLNNKGVIRMIEGYFTELAFIYAELYRLCKPGALVAFVNDNVRYGGEVIPVDFLSTSFAEQFGFKAEKVYCLKQQKGNSSQQMAKYGRVALRKSITIWRK